MGTVLYEFHFAWLSSLILLIPLIVGLGFFFCYKWYPAQNLIEQWRECKYRHGKNNAGKLSEHGAAR